MAVRLCRECLYLHKACSGSNAVCNVFTDSKVGYHWTVPEPKYGPTECFWPVHQWHWWTDNPCSPCCGANTIDKGTVGERILVCSSCSRITKRCLHLVQVGVTQ